MALTFYKNDIATPEIIVGKLNKLVGHVPAEPLCFTALSDGATIGMINTGGNVPNIEYSRDSIRWATWDCSTITLANSGDTVYMRGYNPNGFSKTANKCSYFVIKYFYFPKNSREIIKSVFLDGRWV